MKYLVNIVTLMLALAAMAAFAYMIVGLQPTITAHVGQVVATGQAGVNWAEIGRAVFLLLLGCSAWLAFLAARDIWRITRQPRPKAIRRSEHTLTAALASIFSP